MSVLTSDCELALGTGGSSDVKLGVHAWEQTVFHIQFSLAVGFKVVA